MDLKGKSEPTRHDGVHSNQPQHPDWPSFGNTGFCGQPNRTFLAIYPRLSKEHPRHLTAFTGGGEKLELSLRQQACRQTNGHASVCPPPLRTPRSHPRKQRPSTWEKSRSLPACSSPSNRGGTSEGCSRGSQPAPGTSRRPLVVPPSRAGAYGKKDTSSRCFHATNRKKRKKKKIENDNRRNGKQ